MKEQQGVLSWNSRATVAGMGKSSPRGPDSSQVVCPSRQKLLSQREEQPQLPAGQTTWVEPGPSRTGFAHAFILATLFFYNRIFEWKIDLDE